MVLCGVILLLLIAGVVWARCEWILRRNINTKVLHINLVQTVDATVKVESADEIGLRFESVGRFPIFTNS